MNLQQATSKFKAVGIKTAILDAQLLLAHVFGMSRTELLLRTDCELLDENALARFNDLIERRARFEPVSQLIGRREFWGLEFLVNKHVLTPRPDSETLIESLLRAVPDRSLPLNILDLGSGSGCLLLAAISEYKNARGLGIDISEEAVDIANENSKNLGFSERTVFKKSDFKKSNWNLETDGVWNIIISNPPYIASSEIDSLDKDVALYEPRLALDGGISGMDCYRDIIAILPSLMVGGAFAFIEAGAGQARAIAAMAEDNNLKIANIACDLAGIERCVVITR